jgi:uncharacterized protein (TIGR00251 family)
MTEAAMKKETASSVRLSLRVTPRASRDELRRNPDGSLTLRLTAPPVEGAANAACCAFLADLFGVNKSKVRVVVGEKSRDKVVEIEGWTREQVDEIVGAKHCGKE